MMQIEVITGPTASGKTHLALQRTEENSAIEMVNADASVLYRGFDIGTAKPSKETMMRIPHHLIDFLEPDQRCNAAQYALLARKVIREIISRRKTPLVVGGTGFYIDALFFGITPVDAGEEKMEMSRIRVAQQMKESGFDEMLEKLRDVDPVLYKQISRERNPRRLERAWEFYYATGVTLGMARKVKPEPFEFEPAFTLIEVEKEVLRLNIIRRIDAMLKAGWLNEVEHLLSKGITTEMPAMNAIGYRELVGVLLNEKTLEQAREEIIIRTRQYAKRQVTWMKRYKGS
ncbi:MAG: tRNA (adenosine(37)-N6)-dimethylallyltransferase MiaA [Candidatus Kapaibacterium sp.]